MAGQRLNQRRGLMTQTIRRAQPTSQVFICHLHSYHDFSSCCSMQPLPGGPGTVWSLFVKHCSLCVASPPMYP